MSEESDNETSSIDAAVGDVLFARGRIPYPGLILQGFQRRHRDIPELEPYVSFADLRALLEFLEFVVLTERMVVPVPVFTKKTERIISSRRNWVEFSVFAAKGDLELETEEIVERLESAGVLVEARIEVGDPTADAVAARLIPRSKTLQAELDRRLEFAPALTRADPHSFASAQMAFWCGAPLHVAEAAAAAKIPYVLSRIDERHLGGYERENLRTRKAVTELLLDRLNGGAKREIARLADLGLDMQFPETPIASMIVRNASSPIGLIDAALQLRSQFKEFRHHVNALESDLSSKVLPLKARLKRAREIELLAQSLWPAQETDLRASAVGVADAFFAIPEAASAPSVSSIKTLADKLVALPLERLVELYRRRRVRLLLKAKRQFLRAPNLDAKIAGILGVPAEVVSRSRGMSMPNLTAAYAAKHPEFAAVWYGNSRSGGAA